MTVFEQPDTVIDRDGNGNPRILQADGKLRSYSRPSTLGKLIESTYNLELWSQRQVAVGLASRPDLILAVQTSKGDKTRLNRLCGDAREAAKSSAAATTGTGLHAVTELDDLGQQLPDGLSQDVLADLHAYRAATAGLTHVAIEQFMVNDQHQLAGTPDRLSLLEDPSQCCDRWHVADLKTGSIRYGQVGIAAQLATYAHSDIYNPADGSRSTVDMCLDRAIVIHLPAGSGTCSLHWTDIRAGWELVLLALQVRAARNLKGLILNDGPDRRPVELGQAIADCRSEDELVALWRARKSEWDATADLAARSHREFLAAQAAA